MLITLGRHHVVIFTGTEGICNQNVEDEALFVATELREENVNVAVYENKLLVRKVVGKRKFNFIA